MWIRPNGDLSPAVVHRLVLAKMQLSRFTCRMDTERMGKTDRTMGVKLTTIRLKRKKPYCGAHPGPCLNTFRRHSNSHYLEGLDWVGFNDMLNDALDEVSADCTVFSYNRESLVTGRYFIRRGRLRRVGYPFSYRGNFAHWLQGDFVADFEDHCGKPPPPVSWHTKDAGTPGYPCYSITEEEKYRAEEAEIEA